jgi:GGDEF domain-containing protein
MTSESNGTAARQAPRLSITQMLGVIRVEFHRARTQRYPLCCLMIAVDGLEEVASRDGWEAKAASMATAYDLLKRIAREHGFIGMAVQSGDRIMAVFPNTSTERMGELGSRLLEAGRALATTSVSGLALSFSLGASHNLLAETNSSFGGLVESAGRALHLATQSGGGRYVMWREAESEIEALRGEMAAATKSFRAEQETLEEEAGDAGGLQRAELVDKIQRIFASVTRTPDIDSLQTQIIELAVTELYEERRKAVAAQMREHARQVETLERRIAKLTSVIGVTEEELARVMAMKMVDPGVASIFKTVQGLRGDDPQAQAKKAMMSTIFEENLSFQKKKDTQAAAVA